MSKTTSLTSLSHVLLLRGRHAVAEHATLLEQLAARCGQSAAMHWLQFFLAAPDFQRKDPCLILLTHSETEPRALSVENVRAAVLLFEYRFLGLPTGIFCTDDSSAFRTVISRIEDRQTAAVAAVQALVQAGANIVLISRDDGGLATGPPLFNGALPVLWSHRTRPVAKTLILEPTYEATLKKFGKSTRFNLGYYRRRLLARMPCEFVADARGLLTEGDLQAANTGSLNPGDWKLIDLQYAAACHLHGGFLIGLRGPLGQWLSLVGGWRQENTTVLHWQINARGYERSSISTVMRSYFLESEIARGTRLLTFYGGTPHSMQHSFVKEHATDLVVRKRSLKATLLIGVARIAGVVQRRFGRVNFLLEVLSDRNLHWSDPQTLPHISEAPLPRKDAPGARVGDLLSD